jgi:hypothetical protein
MDEIAADPEKGLEAAIAAVPELASAREKELAILEATIAAWEPRDESAAYGAIDVAAWDASIAYLDELGLVDDPVTPDGLLDRSFTAH